MREVRPDHEPKGQRFGLVAARFNEGYVRRLVDAALASLRGRGVAEQDLEVHWVPGALELPLAARWMAQSMAPDAILAFGVIIRGETEHFRLVADGSAQGLMRVMLDTGVPVLNGVLAAHDSAQVEARCGGVMGNRGAELALAAMSMARLRAEVAPRG